MQDQRKLLERVAWHVEEILDSLEQTFAAIDPTGAVFSEVVVTADSGFNSEQSIQALQDRDIDAYAADPKFSNQQEYQTKTIDRERTSKARNYFTADEFSFDASGALICPAGKPMKSRCPKRRSKERGYTGRTYMSYPEYCLKCNLKSKCMRGSKSQARPSDENRTGRATRTEECCAVDDRTV